MRFNVNQEVKVRLTDQGRALLSAYLIELWSTDKASERWPEDKDGWTKFQMHELMHVFGKHMYNGKPTLPFEPTIELIESPEWPPR